MKGRRPIPRPRTGHDDHEEVRRRGTGEPLREGLFLESLKGLMSSL